MDRIDSNDVWRQIPPEEKFSLMARAHADGMMAALITVGVASTMAVCLQMPWLMWSSLIMSPIVFQLAAGKAWRGLRPRIMLEYLAARSAARRYAYTANAKDLGINVMLRGKMEVQFEQDNIQEALEAAISNTKDAEIWITLFNDAVVMMSEKPGGAKCEFAQLIDDKLKISSKSLDDEGDYSSAKEVFLTSNERGKPPRTIKITSPYPAALVVFEKKLRAKIEESRSNAISSASNLLASGNDDKY